jgi:hypothetical protein
MKNRIDDLDFLNGRNLRRYFAGIAAEAGAVLTLAIIAGLIVFFCSLVWK